MVNADRKEEPLTGEEKLCLFPLDKTAGMLWMAPKTEVHGKGGEDRRGGSKARDLNHREIGCMSHLLVAPGVQARAILDAFVKECQFSSSLGVGFEQMPRLWGQIGIVPEPFVGLSSENEAFEVLGVVRSLAGKDDGILFGEDPANECQPPIESKLSPMWHDETLQVDSLGLVERDPFGTQGMSDG
jgi:hypothetical protein